MHYTLADLQAMERQDGYINTFEWRAKDSRITMSCRMDPSCWFSATDLFHEIQLGLTTSSTIPAGAYRIAFHAGRNAFRTLPANLPDSVSGAVHRNIFMGENDFYIIMTADPGSCVHLLADGAGSGRDRLYMGPDTDEQCRRLLVATRSMTNARRMEVMDPQVPAGPATRASMHILLSAGALALIACVLLLLDRPDPQSLLAMFHF